MCNNKIILDEKYLRDYEPDFSKLKGCFPPDMFLITKEKLSVSAHKIVLARDSFWKDLIASMTGAAGVCPSEPLTIFLPDFDYKTVKLMLKLYYTETVKLNTDQQESFRQLIRSFNPSFGLYNGKCRICNDEVGQQNIRDHVVHHIKECASKDIKKNEEKTSVLVLRCSFTHPRNCAMETDRTKVANGIFNNDGVSDEDVNDIIKEHYRKHLRDEMNYLRKTCGSNISTESDEELYEMADINFSDANLPEDFLKGVSMAGAGQIQITDYMADVQDDDYSGGLESPEPQDGDSVDFNSRTSPELQTSHDNLMNEDQSKAPEDYIDEDINQKSGGSRRSSMELEEDTTQIWACKHCSSKIKFLGGFRKHFVSKHIYKELEKIITASEDVDINSLKCSKCKKSEDRDKVWPNLKMFVPHMALVHNALDEFLQSKGETIEDHYNAAHGKTRNLSGASHGSLHRSEASPARSNVSEQDSDSNSEADAIWGQAFGGENPKPKEDDHSQEKGNADTEERLDDSDTEDEKKEGSGLDRTEVDNADEEGMEDERNDENNDDMVDEHNNDSEDEKETLPPGPEDNQHMDVDS